MPAIRTASSKPSSAIVNPAGAPQSGNVAFRSLGDLFAERENNFNFIRLAASLLVIYGHSYAVTRAAGMDFFTRLVGWGFTGGVAVDAFFVISGFLVTASAMKGDWRRYVAARVLRIYPGLVLCVTLTTFVLGPLITTDPGYWKSHQTWQYWINNSTAFRTEFFLPGVFGGLTNSGVNGVLWSVIIEVRMYIVVLILYCVGILKRRSLFNVLIFAVLTLGYLSPASVLFGYGATDQHVAGLYLIGMFCWVNRDNIVLNEFILLGLLCLAATAMGTSRFIVGYSVLVAYSVFMLAFLPGLGWFRRLGDYSYGVYLYGWPVQQCVLRLDPNMPAWKNAIISGPIALGIGIISWHFFEKPLLSMKDRAARWLGRTRGLSPESAG